MPYRRDRRSGLPNGRVRGDTTRIVDETYYIDPDMDATDPEHLEIDNSPNDYNHQGLVDTISEGTISVPHSYSQTIRDAEIDQSEVDAAAEELVKSAMPALGLDVIHARRMRIYHVQLARTGVGVPGPMTRLLFENRQRRYFIVILDVPTTTDVWIATGPSVGGNNDTMLVNANFSAPFWHNGEVWVGAGATAATVSFSIVEFLSA